MHHLGGIVCGRMEQHVHLSLARDPPRSVSSEDKLQADHPLPKFLLSRDRRSSTAASRMSSGDCVSVTSPMPRTNRDPGFLRFALPARSRQPSGSDSDDTHGNDDDYHTNEVQALRSQLNDFIDYDRRRNEDLMLLF